METMPTIRLRRLITEAKAQASLKGDKPLVGTGLDSGFIPLPPASAYVEGHSLASYATFLKTDPKRHDVFSVSKMAESWGLDVFASIFHSPPIVPPGGSHAELLNLQNEQWAKEQILYANSERHKGKRENALGIVGHVISVCPRFVPAHVARARLLLDKNDVKMALNELERALDYGGSAEAHELRKRCIVELSGRLSPASKAKLVKKLRIAQKLRDDESTSSSSSSSSSSSEQAEQIIGPLPPEKRKRHKHRSKQSKHRHRHKHRKR